MKEIICVLFIVFISSCSTVKHQNHVSSSQMAEPGKCYAKCLIQDDRDTDTLRYYRYTGTETPNGATIISRELVIKEGGTDWTKKIVDPNCISSNQDDCLVWCLVEGVPETKQIVEVTDTTAVKDFVHDSILVDVVVKKGGFTEWKEIVCEKDQSKKLVANIQKQLVNAGYDTSGEEPGVYGKKTKKALVEYQKDNGLPVGTLNIETIKHLGL